MHCFVCNPKLLVQTSHTALDVTIQAQVLELMKELIRKYEMSVLLITHDLGVVARSDEVAAFMPVSGGKRNGGRYF